MYNDNVMMYKTISTVSKAKNPGAATPGFFFRLLPPVILLPVPFQPFADAVCTAASMEDDDFAMLVDNATKYQEMISSDIPD